MKSNYTKAWIFWPESIPINLRHLTELLVLMVLSALVSNIVNEERQLLLGGDWVELRSNPVLEFLLPPWSDHSPILKDLKSQWDDSRTLCRRASIWRSVVVLTTQHAAKGNAHSSLLHPKLQHGCKVIALIAPVLGNCICSGFLMVISSCRPLHGPVAGGQRPLVWTLHHSLPVRALLNQCNEWIYILKVWKSKLLRDYFLAPSPK